MKRFMRVSKRVPRRDAPVFSALALGIALVALGFAAVPAIAETAPEAAPAPDWVQPPRNLPKPQRGDHSYSIDTLFDALKIAPDDDSARVIEEHIWAAWVVSGSDTCNLLMGRVKAAADDKDYDLAVKLLDAVIELKPDYVEAWNRRATVYYLEKDYGHALADIREVLAREPRHFGALAGLGVILQELGDDKHALDAYRRALAINPHLEHIPDVVKSLTEKVDGRDI
jgi:tetratricopeptide (TPR) repeat protein